MTGLEGRRADPVQNDDRQRQEVDRDSHDREEMDSPERWRKAVAASLRGEHVVEAERAPEQPHRRAHRRESDRQASHRERDLPAMDWQLPAAGGLVALSKRERQTRHELQCVCEGAARYGEPHDRAAGPEVHSDGDSWVSTTRTASTLTTCQ